MSTLKLATRRTEIKAPQLIILRRKKQRSQQLIILLEL